MTCVAVIFRAFIQIWREFIYSYIKNTIYDFKRLTLSSSLTTILIVLTSILWLSEDFFASTVEKAWSLWVHKTHFLLSSSTPSSWGSSCVDCAFPFPSYFQFPLPHVLSTLLCLLPNEEKANGFPSLFPCFFVQPLSFFTFSLFPPSESFR